jgi:dimeric dUTPase (all-alpha-NTP-PPase superfamily)
MYKKEHADMIRTMLKLQDEMNTRVNPSWRKAGYPWYRAVWVECAEMMDHNGWKWWKKQEPNLAQLHLELVDVWHFGLSDLTASTRFTQGVDDIVDTFRLWQDDEHPDVCQLIEDLAANTLGDRRFYLNGFTRLCANVGLPLEALYRQYIGKNALNFFRQDHGYKTGEYIKHWDPMTGAEDNVYLAKLLEDDTLEQRSPTASLFDIIYAALAAEYAEVKRDCGAA